MPYNLGAMRSHFRFLIRDPNGDALTNNEVRDNYLLPAHQEYWRRFVRFPFLTLFTQAVALGDELVVFPVALFNTEIEYCLRDIGGGNFAGLQRDEFNRIRYLQETEGATGAPSIYAPMRSSSAGAATTTVAIYPIADAAYSLDLYVEPVAAPATLPFDSSVLTADPVSARYVTRLAAYRAAVDLRLAPHIVRATVESLPRWLKTAFNIQHGFDDKPVPKEASVGYVEQPDRV